MALQRSTSSPSLDKLKADTFSSLTSGQPSDVGKYKKRQKRCSGCHIPHDDHLWGTPGPHCQGPVHGVLPQLEDQLPFDWDDDDKKPFAEALSPLASASGAVGTKENPKLTKA